MSKITRKITKSFNRKLRIKQDFNMRKFEILENRIAMSVDLNLNIMASAMALPSGYNPQQVRHAYALDNVVENGTTLDGTGQTIAIIDAYDAPNIAADLQKFDQTFGLPTADLTVIKQTSNGQPPQPNVNWSIETSLDVEWAHAMAPGAKILLVETPDASGSLYAASSWAAGQPNVSAISMSWGQIDNTYENTKRN
jgi:subtilase family serine protease